MDVHTRRHVINTAGPKLSTPNLSRCKAKISDRNFLSTFLETENVLGLEIAMINTHGVAVLDSINELKEDILDQRIVVEVRSIVQDLSEKVGVGSEIHDDEGVLRIRIRDNAMERDDVWMLRNKGVESGLAHVKLTLTRGSCGCLRSLGSMWETLDSILMLPTVSGDGTIDDTISAITKNISELEGTIVDESANGGGRWGSGGGSG